MAGDLPIYLLDNSSSNLNNCLQNVQLNRIIWGMSVEMVQS